MTKAPYRDDQFTIIQDLQARVARLELERTMPTAQFYTTAQLAVPSATSTWTQIILGTIWYDMGTTEPQISQSGVTVTIEQPGLYALTALGVYEANATGARYTYITKNGTESSAIIQTTGGATPAGATIRVTSGQARLVAGDILRVYSWQNSGTALDLTGSLWGAWISQ